MSEQPREHEGKSAQSPAEGVGDALRAAVERTLAATADSATGTRQRAQGLLDDVVRRGQVAREEVARRGEEATARLAGAIGERRAGDEGVDELRGRVQGIELRLARIEVAMLDPNAQLEAESRRVERLRQPDSESEES
jgi:polyhydroxyalkanoate synthesis regulator phasin